MGIYNLDADEIADAMETVELEKHCAGDFSEKTFIAGTKEYLKRLKKQGAYIPK